MIINKDSLSLRLQIQGLHSREVILEKEVSIVSLMWCDVMLVSQKLSDANIIARRNFHHTCSSATPNFIIIWVVLLSASDCKVALTNCSNKYVGVEGFHGKEHLWAEASQWGTSLRIIQREFPHCMHILLAGEHKCTQCINDHAVPPRTQILNFLVI